MATRERFALRQAGAVILPLILLALGVTLCTGKLHHAWPAPLGVWAAFSGALIAGGCAGIMRLLGWQRRCTLLSMAVIVGLATIVGQHLYLARASLATNQAMWQERVGQDPRSAFFRPSPDEDSPSLWQYLGQAAATRWQIWGADAAILLTSTVILARYTAGYLPQQPKSQSAPSPGDQRTNR